LNCERIQECDQANLRSGKVAAPSMVTRRSRLIKMGPDAVYHESSTIPLTGTDLQLFACLRIPPELLASAGIARVTDTQAKESFGVRWTGDAGGIVFPYWIDGEFKTCRIRRDFPEIVNGKIENKYLAPYGDRRHVYVLPGYEILIADPKVSILLVEAEKSVLAVAAYAARVGSNILPVGIGGCNGWRCKTGKKLRPDGSQEDEKGILPELAAWARDGRVVGILFDANCGSNSDVQAARAALKKQLEKQKAKVVIFDLPVIDGVNGADDFIGIAGDKAFLDLLNQESAAGAIDLLGQSLSDYGNAQRLIASCSQNLRYCPAMGKWLIWDQHRWKIDTLDEIRKLTQNMFVEFVTRAMAAESKDVSRFAGQCLNSQRITAAIREAQPLLAVAPDELDSHPWLLNFLNGTLDLRSFELQPHSREHLITKVVHHNYNPHARAPRFVAFLTRLLGPLAFYVQKATGYSVTGTTREKVAFLCLGKTDSGKTTLLALIRDLFSEYATLILIDSLMQKDEDNNSRADLADLRGVRFAMTSETEEGQRLRESKLKRITQGQGKIKSVRKYENPIEFPETHKLWVDANHRPMVRGTDDAIWNRLVPIPFDRPLSESEIDPDLPAKLRQEAEGIIAWILEGTLLWQRDGLGEIPQIESARSTWRKEMDRLAAFREARCVEDPSLSIQARPLYIEYRKWVEEVGERPMSETMFSLRMTDAGFEKDPTVKDRRVYIGIALKDLFNG
jgi:P4 family phage/plasmid primase-like protien